MSFFVLSLSSFLSQLSHQPEAEESDPDSFTRPHKVKDAEQGQQIFVMVVVNQ